MGLGHAILMAKEFIKDEFFGVMLPDDLVFCQNDFALWQLIEIANKEKATVIGVQEVQKESVSSYGIVEIRNKINSNLFEVSSLIEKPTWQDAPSNLAIIGRYILSNKIFHSIEAIQNEPCNEIQLTNAIAHMIKQGNKVLAYKIQGIRYDLGTPSGWLKANIAVSKQLGL
jgi:UTP--glucose-1-phosphate uridylyltransferase